MKVRNALIIVGLATVATTSFAASAYHASPAQCRSREQYLLPTIWATP